MGHKDAGLNRTARAGWALLAGTVLLLAVAPPALADVKEGVDAWTRGNYQAAVAQWRGPAAAGDPDAMFNMGQAYKLGLGVPKDLTKAESFYAKAVQKGHVRAADNYGILLFQTNRQNEAMPLLNAAAGRGEPRAMYILGIAAYNGDYAPRDLVRAYALMTRAAQTGLQQAISSLATMNDSIPLEQRQQGVALASEMDHKSSATRASEMGSADLGSATAPAIALAKPPINAAMPMPSSSDAAAARYEPVRPVAHTTQTTPATPAAKAVLPAAPTSGTWRIQFGAFGQKANADALWARLRNRPEITGHPRIDAGNGVARLLAGGYSQAEAHRVCAVLQTAGFSCLVVNR